MSSKKELNFHLKELFQTNSYWNSQNKAKLWVKDLKTSHDPILKEQQWENDWNQKRRAPKIKNFQNHILLVRKNQKLLKFFKKMSTEQLKMFKANHFRVKMRCLKKWESKLVNWIKWSSLFRLRRDQISWIRIQKAQIVPNIQF